MGDRANYAILNKGKLSVFYAHWGGPTVPRELKAGPAACERFIRTQERVRSKQFLDFPFMEGGIALDKDRRRALVFGGPGAVNYDERVQARLIERLMPIWQKEGWSISWARRYAYDFVSFLGLGGEAVESELHGMEPAPWDEVVKVPAWTGTLLARKVGEGWELRRSAEGPGRLIDYGARLVEAFGELAAIGEDGVDSSDLERATALLFDEGARRLILVAPLFASLNAPSRLLTRARSAFPDWTVELDLDLSLPAERLRSRGITVPERAQGEAGSEAASEGTSEASSEAEIDELLDRVLDYHPEEQIEALTEAAEDLMANIAAEAESKGGSVHIIRNLPKASKTRSAKGSAPPAVAKRSAKRGQRRR